MVARILMLTAAVLIAGLAVSSCGKRGGLVWPEGSTYPRQYPPPDQPPAQ
jgi:hypothetical protein